MFQLPGGWNGQSGTMMEGGMQLLNRDGHSISHNSKRHYHDSFVSMNRMRQRGLLCDIVLHVSNKEIKAHKVVLASCSPYFHAMFTSKSGFGMASLFFRRVYDTTVSSYFSFLLSSLRTVRGGELSGRRVFLYVSRVRNRQFLLSASALLSSVDRGVQTLCVTSFGLFGYRR